MSSRSKNRKDERKPETAEMRQINKDPDDPVSRHKIMTHLRQIKNRITHDIRRLVSVSLLLLDIVISRFFWIQISLYRFIAKKEPLYLTGKKLAVNETTRRPEESLASLQRESDYLQTDNQNKHSTIEHLKYNLREAEEEKKRFQRENDDLKIKLASIRREKEDALRRLSEGVMVKLKDNNPNIVDLNDQHRPTKLAEMFSELYDNEWTTAFASLEEQFTEVQAVVILLDTVMEAYYYCKKTLEEPWRILSKWFLNPNLTGSQQTVKWLKDSRKSLVLDKLEEVNEELEELLLSICKIPEVEEILLQKPLQDYTRKCIELCLLMVTTDPPVILGCPGWIPSKPLTKEEKIKTKAKANQQTVEEMRNGTDADKMKMKQRHDENDATPETSNAEQCIQHKDSAAKIDRDSEDGTKQTEEVEEEKSEEENGESNSSSSSYDTLKDLEQTTNNQKQSTEVQEILSEPPEGSTIDSFLGNTETDTKTSTDQFDAHSQSDVQPVREAAQSDGEEAKQESKNQKVEGSKREDEETLRKDEEAKEDVQPVREAAQSEGEGAKQESKNQKVENSKREDEETLRKAEAKDVQPVREVAQSDGDGAKQESKNQKVEASKREDEETLKKDEEAKEDVQPVREVAQSDGEGAKQESKNQKVENSKREDEETLRKAEAKEDVQPVREVAQSDGDGAKQESKNQKVEASKREDEETLRKDEEAKEDVQPVREAAQSDGEGAKQESKNQKVEGSKREDEETLRKDEDAKEDGKEEQQHKNGKEAAIKEERKKDADSMNNGKTEEEEELVERHQFDKDKFKEYTTRGKYLEFVVWPAMYLHKGGPLLGKGVAQGTKEPKRKARQQLWSWRNVNA